MVDVRESLVKTANINTLSLWTQDGCRLSNYLGLWGHFRLLHFNQWLWVYSKYRRTKNVPKRFVNFFKILPEAMLAQKRLTGHQSAEEN